MTRRISGMLFSTSLVFFSLNAFSVRATAVAYGLIYILAGINGFKLIKLRSGLGIASLAVLAGTAVVWMMSILHNFYLNYFIKFVFIQIYVALIYLCFRAEILRDTELRNACRILIYVQAAFFLGQLLYFVAVGQFLDLNNYVREVESESLYMTKALEGNLLGIRAVGLFSEPSFYAMVVLSPASVLLAMDRKLTFSVMVAIGTAVLSFSVAAILISALMIGVFLMTGRSSKWLKSIVVILALAVSPYVMDFYQLRVLEAVDYDAISSRQLVFEEFQRRKWDDNAFGTGFFWDETKQIGVTGLWGYHVRDSSFLVYLYFTSGFIGCLMFAALVAYTFRGCLVELLFFAPLLLFKFHILFGILWFLFISYALVCIWRRRAKGRGRVGLINHSQRYPVPSR